VSCASFSQLFRLAAWPRPPSTARGIEPTQYGRALLRRGVVVFDELKQGVQEIAHLAHNEFCRFLTTTSPVIPQLLTCERTSIGDALVPLADVRSGLTCRDGPPCFTAPPQRTKRRRR
jgi:hypothetical protein